MISLFDMVNNMGADDLATQGARASATMVLAQLSRDNSPPYVQSPLCLLVICQSDNGGRGLMYSLFIVHTLALGSWIE